MREFKNKNVQILSVEAKDLLTKNYCVDDKSLRKGSLDYSMETDELRNLSKTLIKEDKKKDVKSDKKKSLNTAYSYNMGQWMALLLMSGFVLVLTVFKKKKN